MSCDRWESSEAKPGRCGGRETAETPMEPARITVEQILDDERTVAFGDPDRSYLRAYREFVHFFAQLEIVEPHDLIIAAHFVYGWMPTILDLKAANRQDLELACGIVDAVRSGKRVEERELAFLKKMINNSIVGASKLLHFARPDVYAIWDSQVYKYVYRHKPYHYRVNKVPVYCAYLEMCHGLVREPGFVPAWESIKHKLGYEVSALRALELVMYTHGRELDY